VTAEPGAAPVEGRLVIRFVSFGVVIILTAGLLIVRLFALQVTAGARYTELATANRTVVQAIPSTRGLIYDRNGQPLVTNVATYSVKIRPADLPESRRDSVVATLSRLLDKDPLDINLAIDSNPGSRYDPVRIATNVDQTVADFISESSQDLPGVEVDIETRRDYAYGPLLSQVLGYTGPVNASELQRLGDQGYLPDDVIGRAGVEATYETQLRGQYGLQTIERDAAGQQVQVLETNRDSVPGSSLRLSIDLHMQELAQKALAWGMAKAHLKRGAFIVMNPQTGEVLAMASLPTYDDNLFAQGISTKQYAAIVNDPNHPLLNEGISNQQPPGSTYKMVTSIAALSDGKLNTTERLRTAGFLTLGGQRFYDWNLRGFGLCNLQCGFAFSSDTFFYQVAARVGIDRLSYWSHQLGFGAPTGIDLPNEASGIIPSNQWKMETFGEPIRPGEVYLAGIGQGYDAVTPLQILNAYCAVINGGTLLEPRVVEDVIGPDGQVVTPYTPQVLRELKVSAGILRTMRINARHVVTGGHTLNLSKEPFIVAGKTGTAQFGSPLPNGNLPYHEWFVGWVPKDPWQHASDPGGYQAAARTDAQLAFIAFSYEANTRGNPSTEISKYFLQMYFGTTHDYRLMSELTRARGY
jgi:penicillin-binding protein 2